MNILAVNHKLKGHVGKLRADHFGKSKRIFPNKIRCFE